MSFENENAVYSKAINFFGKETIINDSIEDFGNLIMTIKRFENSKIDSFQARNVLVDALTSTRLLRAIYDEFVVFHPHSYDAESLNPDNLIAFYKGVIRESAGIIIAFNSKMISPAAVDKLLTGFDHSLYQLGIMLDKNHFNTRYETNLKMLEKDVDTQKMLVK